ncbi:MAG TPA: hypothetical protein DDZ80_04280 [Cyanobacteria bacterium UBA8803]|nr:hypothetical protein [Cyanobacteria bacterium UBA9273]HBL57775.1 hypothetical protein [Cyanobacteria bacterium UBA8803]
MKRTFTRKVKHVPTCAADSFDGLSKLSVGKHPVGAAIPTEVNRRARTSAAMIGLAISMGASGLLLPQQGDEAMAVEPMAAEPTVTNLPDTPETSVSTPEAEESEVATVSKSSMHTKAEPALESKSSRPPVVEHKVQEGQSLWDISQTYKVQPEAIAASNKLESNHVLPAGQNLKIPSVNGIVHQVKAGETVETVSKSYGVNPTQLQIPAAVSESGQLSVGESVTVPGKVDDLLKARQDAALDGLKERRNRLNDSLAEWRSEESTNLSELETAPRLPRVTAEATPKVNLPPAVLEPNESKGSASEPSVRVPTSPVVIPVPSPQIAASPTVKSETASQPQLPVVIPVPTPETAASPQGEAQVNNQTQLPVVIPVPTPDTAASLAVGAQSESRPPSSVVIPVPSPGSASSSSEELPPLILPNPGTEPVKTPETAAKPPVPQPVVIEPLAVTPSNNTYRVKPGDTLDAIARRYGLSRSELIQANGLNNPNLIRVNQQLRIPGSQSTETGVETVALLPGITTKSDNVASAQEQRVFGAPTLVVPTVPNPATPVVPTVLQSQPRSVTPRVVAQSTVGVDAQANSRVVVEAKRNQSVNSETDPYVERLRADILRMREEYRRQRTTGETSATANIAVPAVPVVSSVENRATPSRTNPEFNPKRYEQETQQASIPIEVPPPASTSQTSQRQLMAVAPAPAESYNPMLQTPVGQRVSPELPPLSAPDMYLPDSPARFNGYIWPSKGVLTSGYGMRWGRMHKGIDIAAPIGTPIVAAAPGVVVTAGWNSGGYGNLVEIQHPDGSLTLYAHNNRILVRRGQEVAQGQQISEMGSTGYSTGPHLHFEVHPGGRGAVNPMAFLPRKS